MAIEAGRSGRSVRKRRSRGRESTAIRSQISAFLAQMLRTGRLPAVLVSIGLSVLLSGFLTSSEFTVQQVVVRGNSIAYVDSVVSASDALGQSIFTLDTEQVAERVADHPAVSSAEISSRLPDQVIVSVVERTPVLVWQSNERAFLIDEYGTVLAEAENSGLPLVVQSSGEIPAVGDGISPELIQAMVVVQDHFEDGAMLEYTEGDGIVVHLDSTQHIALGNENAIPKKLAIVDAIVAEDDSWSRLDVRDPDRPVIR